MGSQCQELMKFGSATEEPQSHLVEIRGLVAGVELFPVGRFDRFT